MFCDKIAYKNNRLGGKRQVHIQLFESGDQCRHDINKHKNTYQNHSRQNYGDGYIIAPFTFLISM